MILLHLHLSSVIIISVNLNSILKRLVEMQVDMKEGRGDSRGGRGGRYGSSRWRFKRSGNEGEDHLEIETKRWR